MKKIKKLLTDDLSSVILPVITLFIVLAVSSKGFLSNYNIMSVLQSVAIYVLIGLAQMAALSLGQFNLAVGAMGTLTSIMMGLFMQQLGFPVIAALLAGLIIAMLLGAVQGILIAKSGLNPFMITLALSNVYIGIAAVITQGNSFKELPEMIKNVNRSNIGAVPTTFMISLIICVIVFFVFRYTNTGRYLQASGANRRSAIFSGMNVDNITILGHVISGFFCGCAAFIQICIFNSAQLAIGSDWLVPSFVVAVLGGTLLSGGKVTVVGTLFGAFLMVFINNALGLWKVNTYTFQLIMGIVLLAAYEIDRVRSSIVIRHSILAATSDKEDENE